MWQARRTLKTLASSSVLLAATSLAVIAGAAPPARADETHRFLSRITEVQTGPNIADPGTLGKLNRLTVAGEDLWAAEGAAGFSVFPDNSRVDEFDASGKVVRQINEGQAVELLEGGIAVAEPGGNQAVYVGGATELGAAVFVFGNEGEAPSTWTGLGTPLVSFGAPSLTGLAFDGSATTPEDWARGDLYVADNEQRVIDVLKPQAGRIESYVTQITGVTLGGASFAGSNPEEPFTEITGIAVDEVTGDLVVGSGGETPAVDVLEPEGSTGEYRVVLHLTGREETPFSSVQAVAIDSGDGDIYVEDVAQNEVDEFNASGEYVGSITGIQSESGGPVEAFHRLAGLAVSPTTHHVYVANDLPESGEIDEFGPNIVLPHVVTEAATNIEPSGAVLAGTVNPEGVGPAKCRFVWTSAGAGEADLPCEPSEVANGTVASRVSSTLSGLAPDTEYSFRLEAENGNGAKSGKTLSFITAGPGMHGEWATKVTADSATLEAHVNPHKASTYVRFQYGTASVTEHESPALVGEDAPYGELVGEGEGDVPVRRAVTGLTSGSLYHYRLVVASEVQQGVFKEFMEPEGTFLTQASSGEGLLDGRAWELVSPPDKHGAFIEPISEAGVIEAASSGGAITYLANAPTELDAQGYASRVQVLSQRGASGWLSKDIATPHEASTGVSLSHGYEYRYFSPDLSQAVVEPQGTFTPLTNEEVAPIAHERTVYRRANALCSSAPCFTPLVTAANIPSGTELNGNPVELEGEIRFEGATENLEDIIVKSGVALTSAVGDEGGLYEWLGGKLQQVSILPPGETGEPTKSAEFGFGDGEGTVNARDAVTPDGSRIVWTSRVANGSEEHLYLRDMTARETVRLDAAQPGLPSGRDLPVFEDASSNDSRILFTDSRPLLPGAKGTELYMCEIKHGSAGLECALTAVAPSVAQFVLGVNSEATDVYFVSTEALAAHSRAGVYNLYMAHEESNGVWSEKFIAALAAQDSPDWGGQGGGGKYLAGMTSRVSPNGRFLAFMSSESLTGYDNHDAATGVPDEEVYLYDAASESLICASCNPTGARPAGTTTSVTVGEDKLFEGRAVWGEGVAIAANVPGWTPYGLAQSLYQSRYLSDSGRLFFNSNDALVPQDVNGAMDVYEFEPPGVGSCSASDTSFSVKTDGCLGLVSSGTSSGESVFLDASETGGDVFFLTTAQLSSQDFDHSFDVYDAHECTAEAPCPSAAPSLPPPCDSGDSCKPAASPQPEGFGSPATATFNGVGNVVASSSHASRPKTRAQTLAAALKACAKKPKRRRPACRALAQRRYGPVRKSKQGRGAASAPRRRAITRAGDGR